MTRKGRNGLESGVTPTEERMRQLETLIETAYSAVYDSSRWKSVLDQFIDLTNADSGAIYAPPLDASFAQALYLTSNIDLTPVLDRNSIYQQQAPFTGRALAAGIVPGVFVNSDVYPTEELHKSDYYLQYMRPLDIEHGLHSVYRAPAEGGGPPVAMSVSRSRRKPAFGEAEVALAREVFPHVRRALGLMLDLQPQRAVNQAMEGALDAFDTACCLIGPGGRLLFANSAARALFDGAGGLSVRKDRLHAQDGGSDAEFQAALAQATNSDAPWSERAPSEVGLRRTSGEGPLVAIVVPLGQENVFFSAGMIRAAVYLVDAAVRPLGTTERARLRSVFALTDAEAAITARLIEGQSVREIADERGTSEQTVRTQIKLILEKTQSARQVDLLRLQRLFAAKTGVRLASPAQKGRPGHAGN
jgi:DNA-binding CsgD family transcriptional regulator/PAS domain-containing protein